MSMNAMFVQTDDKEIARLERDPDAVEALFTDRAASAAGLQDAGEAPATTTTSSSMEARPRYITNVTGL